MRVAHHAVDAGRGAVEVVLADEDDRQVPDGGQVDAFVEGPLGDGAVAEEAGDDVRLFCILNASAMPAASGMPPPTMAMPGTMPLAMLPTCIDPPLPWQQPVVGAEQLEEQLLDRQPLGQGVAVAAEGGGDEIVRLERRADADGRRLLALALVDRAGHRRLRERGT